MNLHGVWAIYRFEMARFGRTVWTSLATPVITTSLYFVVFGSAIGSKMGQVSDVPYGAFIVPGLMLLAIFSESILNASLGIYMPKFTGTMYELLSAPLSPMETVLGYVGAATTKSVIIGMVIFATAHLFVDLHVLHPFAMVGYLVLVAATFCLFGFAIGIWAKVRAVAGHSPARRHPDDLPRRRLLFDRCAAGAVADGHDVQPGRLPDQRVPLDVLWIQ